MNRTTTPIFESVASKATGGLRIRRAIPSDIPALERLIERAVWGLQSRDYGEETLDGALRSGLLAVDSHLISDGTYFVAEIGNRIVGSGGWSQRRKIVNGANDSDESDDTLDAASEAAKARAFYVRPECARMGIGGRLLRESEEAARRAGFLRMELISTLTGAPFYTSRGWRSGESMKIPLPDGQSYPAIRMSKKLEETGYEENRDRASVA
ncbi:MAG: GNAT family N-acetyltransferase [Rubrobacteraceae bacterium]